MYQLITSSVVSAPQSAYILKLLHNNKILYVPANGQRSTNAPSDTKEDMMEIFLQEPDGRPRELKRLMNRRSYAAIMPFDPDGAGLVTPGGFDGGHQAAGSGKLKLAVDFMIQGEGAYQTPTKYGPVVIPNLEFGR